MCGIAGGWWANASGLDEGFSQALWSMRRRGPNDSGHMLYALERGTFGLGHTRLSIIDLTAGGISRCTRRTAVHRSCSMVRYITIASCGRSFPHVAMFLSPTPIRKCF